MEEFKKGRERGNAFARLANMARRIARASRDPERGYRKLFNMALARLSHGLKLDRNLGKPYSALIEVTNICNLECPLCPTGERTLNRKPENMSFETFTKIIDEIAPYCVEVNLTNYGEPLLNKEIFDMVYYAKQRNLRVIMGTNAHFLKDDHSRRALLMSGLDEIYFSLDGAEQRTYEMYRRRGDFSLVVDNVKKMVELKRKLRVASPLIELQFLVMKHNEGDIEKVRELADEIGVDRLAFKPVGFNNADWGREEIVSEFRKFEPAQEKYRIYTHMADDTLGWDKEVPNFCQTLWTGLTILADGRLVPCCLDPRAELVLGHVDDGIFNAWNGARYRNLRKQITTDKKQIKLCARCHGL
ncbi:MAG: radical SAM protein [Candidatus Eisenbacteria bacterium]